MTDNGYLGNQKIKKRGVQQGWTPEMVDEWIRCEEDPIYFCENYVMITDIDEGLIPFTMRGYQKEMITSMFNNRYTVGIMCRQSGKTTTYVGFALHYIIFNDKKTVGLLANKGETAREILEKIQDAYENLPKWLQHGVTLYNKGKFELENDSRIIASSTSSSAIRGYAISCLILDEVAHIDNWDEFYTSVYPTISSGKESKLIMVSTPCGLNHFYNTVEGAKEGQDKRGDIGLNGFACFDVKWQEVPGRDEKWYEETLAALNWDYDKFRQEYENEFLGSSGTLISGGYLKLLTNRQLDPVKKFGDMKVYQEPDDFRNYVVVVDVSRGKGLDYSAFSVIDVTEIPYQQVASYKSNMLSPIEFQNHVYAACKKYGDPYVLVEVNDIGAQISDALTMQYNYEYCLCTRNMGAGGKRVIGTGIGTNKIDAGVRTTKTVKDIGCSLLKVLVESDKLIIPDKDTVHELSVFSKQTDNPKSSYEAESGHNDDLVMGLVLFAWLSDQDYFKELSETDVRSNILSEHQSSAEEDFMIDFFRVDGRDEYAQNRSGEPDISGFF